MENFYNSYAALPSLHFGWAVMFGVFFLRLPNIWGKVCGVIYPALMLCSIIMTGNHYIVDAVGGVLVILVSFFVIELHLQQRFLSVMNSLVQNISSVSRACFFLRARPP